MRSHPRYICMYMRDRKLIGCDGEVNTRVSLPICGYFRCGAGEWAIQIAYFPTMNLYERYICRSCRDLSGRWVYSLLKMIFEEIHHPLSGWCTTTTTTTTTHARKPPTSVRDTTPAEANVIWLSYYGCRVSVGHWVICFTDVSSGGVPNAIIDRLDAGGAKKQRPLIILTLGTNAISLPTAYGENWQPNIRPNLIDVRT